MSAGLECIGKVVFGRLSEDFAAAAELLVRLRVPARLRIALVARLRLLVAALRDMRGGTHIKNIRHNDSLVHIEIQYPLKQNPCSSDRKAKLLISLQKRFRPL